ncbi:MAG: hypothetical protein AAGA56_25075, partial [Myxococcota bacterium]
MEWQAETRVIVADEDDAALRVLDADTLEERSLLRLASSPGHVAVGRGGRMFVTLRHENQLAVIEAGDDGRLHQAGVIETDVEPVAVASHPDGGVMVTAAWGRTLTRYDEAGARSWSVPLAAEPRGLALDETGTTAFVAHAAGSALTRVKLEAMPSAEALRFSGVDQTDWMVDIGFRPPSAKPRAPLAVKFADDLPIPESTSSPRRVSQGFAVVVAGGYAYMPGTVVYPRPSGGGGGAYGSGGALAAQEPLIAAVDVDGKEVRLRVLDGAFSPAAHAIRHSPSHHRDSCLLPRDVAFDRRGHLLVVCHGQDEVLAYPAEPRSMLAVRRARWTVPSGPVSIAVEKESGRAYVYSLEANTVSRLALPNKGSSPRGKGTEKPVVERRLALLSRGRRATALTESARRGRRLFHRVGDGRVSLDGRSCASCHPDGRTDGLTYPTRQGLRQTPMLAGRLAADTAPYGWEGDAQRIEDHLAITFRRLRGKGFGPNDMSDLLAWLREMKTPRRPPPPDPGAVSEGRRLFFDDANFGCAVCHVEGGGSNGQRHAVGTKTEVDTPSLRFVAGTAPYFHDGRFATLDELLLKTAGEMGWNADITVDERRA